MTAPLNPLALLDRPDKWYVGGGNRLIWTPPFPVWLDHPGFWDKAHYYNYEIEPVFTWTLLDEDGHEIPLQGAGRSWRPSGLTCRFTTQREAHKSASARGTGLPSLSLAEVKCCLPNDVLASVLTIRNNTRARRRIHLILWTIQRNEASRQTEWLTDAAYENGRISFTKHLQIPGRPKKEIACAITMNRRPASYGLNLSEGSILHPHWRLTPWFEKFRSGRLPCDTKLTGVTNDGLVHLALHTTLALKHGEETAIAMFFAAAPTSAEASSELHFSTKQQDPAAISEHNWSDAFAGVPSFQCSDEYLTRYYWHRWYGLRLLTLNGQEGNYRHPAVCEGIGYFRAPITYSAACHVLENRWMHDPSLAQGSIAMFLDNQRPDGGFRGYIDVDHYRQEMFYHANWGRALTELDRVHADDRFLNAVYEGFGRYAEYFDRERDAEGSGLYDIDNHYETGQEYMHRYLAVNADADRENWGEVFRLKGVDVSVYLYELKKALARIAGRIGRRADVERWERGASKIREAILATMWDPNTGMFFDVDPATGKRTAVKAATCFYPYMTDLVTGEHIDGMKRHLFNPREFWTPFPVPSSSADDEYFSALPDWKGKRMNCPWNGRVWPMTNSHLAEALANTSLMFHDRLLRKHAAEFITRFIRMMFHDADPKRPNCYEHYNPMTGAPSVYRGVDDYQHSWVADLIIKYVAGVRPLDNSIVIDPFPFTLEHLRIDDLIVRGRRLTVERDRRRYAVWIDGKECGSSRLNTPMVVGNAG